MGFFKKLFKGVKKVVKKIGKGIKSAFKSFGKFMGKLGIIGQIGLGLLLPGVGAMLGKAAGFLIGTGGTVATAAGNFINAALNVGTKVGNVFQTVTKGVTKVVGDVVGAAANKLGLADPIKTLTSKLGMGVDGQGINIGNKKFGDVFQTVSDQANEVLKSGRDLFSMDTLTGEHASVTKYLDDLKVKRDALVPDLPNVSAEMDSVTNEFTGKLVETPDIVAENAMSQAKDLATGPNLTGVENMSRVEIPNAPQMSTVADGVTATEPKSLLTKIVEDPLGTARKGVEYVVEKGATKTGEALTEAFPTMITTASQKAGGAYPDINYNTLTTSVAQLPQSVSIGAGDSPYGVNVAEYISNNTNFVNTSPYGYNAAAWNNYQASMRGVS